MTLRGLIGLLALVVLGLLAWELRWVLLVLFGAVVLAVALDVPVSWLRRFTPMNRPQALVVVVALLLLGGWQLGELLLPELIEQVGSC
jgi:predicted PurR-regulated permease PerM